MSGRFTLARAASCVQRRQRLGLEAAAIPRAALRVSLHQAALPTSRLILRCRGQPQQQIHRQLADDAAASSGGSWFMGVKERIRGCLMAKFSQNIDAENRPIATEQVLKDVLQEALTELETDDSETRWLKIAARAGNGKAFAVLFPDGIDGMRPDGSFGQVGFHPASGAKANKAGASVMSVTTDCTGPDQAHSMELAYAHRIELEVLWKLRGRLEQQASLHAPGTGSTDVLNCGAAAPLKSEKSGHSPLSAQR